MSYRLILTASETIALIEDAAGCTADSSTSRVDDEVQVVWTSFPTWEDAWNFGLRIAEQLKVTDIQVTEV